jgi:hypothetical protein
VSPVFLLDSSWLRDDVFGDLIVPSSLDELIQTAPDPSGARFGDLSQEFVRQHAVQQFADLQTQFYTSFLSTVQLWDAFYDGAGDPHLLPGFNLEVWGFPASAPAHRQLEGGRIDDRVALQRFQGGLMQHDGVTRTTNSVALGYYLKAVLTANRSLAVLSAAAESSPLWAQYSTEGIDWVARPDELPASNLALAFEPEGPAPGS